MLPAIKVWRGRWLRQSRLEGGMTRSRGCIDRPTGMYYQGHHRNAISGLGECTIRSMECIVRSRGPSTGMYYQGHRNVLSCTIRAIGMYYQVHHGNLISGLEECTIRSMECIVRSKGPSTGMYYQVDGMHCQAFRNVLSGRWNASSGLEECTIRAIGM